VRALNSVGASAFSTPVSVITPLPQQLFVLQACLAAGDDHLEGGFAGRERLKTWRGEEITKN